MSLRSSLHWGIGILGAILLLALVGPLVADRSLSQVVRLVAHVGGVMARAGAPRRAGGSVMFA